MNRSLRMLNRKIGFGDGVIRCRRREEAGVTKQAHPLTRSVRLLMGPYARGRNHSQR
jgi:hypothetical protein